MLLSTLSEIALLALVVAGVFLIWSAGPALIVAGVGGFVLLEFDDVVAAVAASRTPRKAK